MQDKSATLEHLDGINFQLRSTYDAAFVAALKARLPVGARRWDKDNRRWIISLIYADQVEALLRSAGYHVQYTLSDSAGSPSPSLVRLNLRLNYLGNLRDRGRGEVWASGADETGRWVYRFPLDVLQRWFGFDLSAPHPSSARSYYDALGVDPGAQTAEIKGAFRRRIKIWHPDVSGDDGSAARILHEAKTVLTDAKLRRRYDAGLRLASFDAGGAKGDEAEIVWVTPARWRCGYLVATVLDGGGTWLVREIHQWTDIVRDDQRMVSWWDDGIQYDWVNL